MTWASSSPWSPRVSRGWVEAVLGTGRDVFEEAVEAAGNRGEELRRRVEALHNLNLRLARRRSHQPHPLLTGDCLLQCRLKLPLPEVGSAQAWDCLDRHRGHVAG